MADPASSLTDPLSTLISTIVSTIVSSAVAWFTARHTVRSDDRRAISDEINKLLEISMEYPFVENPDICEKWPQSNLSQEDSIRYANYCCFCFNLMHGVWEFCGGDREKIRAILHVDELVWKHRRWWKGDPENEKGYPIGFRQAVEAIIQRKNKEMKQ